MDTIILKGNSKSNAKLLMELANKLDFTAKRISAEEAEDIGLIYSIKEGLESGLMVKEEKTRFLKSLSDKK
jgi:enoyl-CoA hydratase/carnithine racemase